MAAKALVNAAKKAVVSITEELEKSKLEHERQSSAETSSNESKSPTVENPVPIEQKPQPKTIKIKQVEKWVSSIHLLLHDPDGFDDFREFIASIEKKKGKLTRDVDFWKQCQMFKDQFKELEESARTIFQTYLEIGAKFEVEVESDTDAIEDKVEDGKDVFPDKTLFDEPQENVRQRLSEGQYVNYCKHLKEKYKL